MAYYEHQTWEVRTNLAYCQECHRLIGQHIGGGERHLIGAIVKRARGWAWYVMPMYGHPSGMGGFVAGDARAFRLACDTFIKHADQRIRKARQALTATRSEEESAA